MSRRPPFVIERPGEFLLANLRYTVTPALVRAIAWASRSSGAIEGMRLSHFGQKRLEAEAKKLRTAQLVARSGTTARLDEIAPVLVGPVLPPRKRMVMTRLRQAAVSCEAARDYAERGDPTTPETFTTYLCRSAEETSSASRTVSGLGGAPTWRSTRWSTAGSS